MATYFVLVGKTVYPVVADANVICFNPVGVVTPVVTEVTCMLVMRHCGSLREMDDVENGNPKESVASVES